MYDRGRGLYEILGVRRDATDKEIKSAYKKLAQKYHPDRHASKTEAEQKEMENKFKEINKAYEILSNEKRRRMYDMTGSVDATTEETVGGGNGFDNMFGGDFSSFFNFSRAGFDFNGGDTFSKIFGDFDSGSEQWRNTSSKSFRSSGRARDEKVNKVFKYTMDVTLEEICKGTKKKLKINKRLFTGEKIENQISVDILPGYKPGTKITFRNAGDENPDGTGTDLVITLAEKAHPYFTLSGNNVIRDYPITLRDALSNERKFVEGILGNTIPLSTDSLTSNTNREIVIPNEGIPDRSNSLKRGSLIIRPRIILDLAPEEMEKIRSILYR